jgi:hypothetical protein
MTLRRATSLLLVPVFACVSSPREPIVFPGPRDTIVAYDVERGCEIWRRSAREALGIEPGECDECCVHSEPRPQWDHRFALVSDLDGDALDDWLAVAYLPGDPKTAPLFETQSIVLASRNGAVLRSERLPGQVVPPFPDDTFGIRSAVDSRSESSGLTEYRVNGVTSEGAPIEIVLRPSGEWSGFEAESFDAAGRAIARGSWKGHGFEREKCAYAFGLDEGRFGAIAAIPLDKRDMPPSDARAALLLVKRGKLNSLSIERAWSTGPEDESYRLRCVGATGTTPQRLILTTAHELGHEPAYFLALTIRDGEWVELWRMRDAVALGLVRDCDGDGVGDIVAGFGFGPHKVAKYWLVSGASGAIVREITLDD